MISRRKFIEQASLFSATIAWRSPFARRSHASSRERRELYPQGVASGDPDPTSVILWTRRPPVQNLQANHLRVEVATEPSFHRIVANATAPISSETDWTCRILAAGLKPRTVYWYRFIDDLGFASRIGRTITAPSQRDARSLSFAFVSCQNVQAGACNAYRRMIWEDEQKPDAEQLGFVLHLGDFVYEIVWYPEDRPEGYYARRLRDIVRYKSGEKISNFHVPTTLDDYRALYAAYLLDPDLQDARARWPFVCMWDNHEFSWKGWQSQQNFGEVKPAQVRKVAANQAWFEYQPARVIKPGASLNEFHAPRVRDTAIVNFDDYGLGLEKNNLAAINSLKSYRSLRFGKNVELILTDNRSFRSEPVLNTSVVAPFETPQFPFVVSENVIEILDAGREFNNGNPPETIKFNGKDIPNPRKEMPAQSMLGAIQKAWFLEKLRTSNAPWKIWGNSVGSLDWRIDLQNLPPDVGPRWPDAGYALLGGDDWSIFRSERAAIFDFIRAHNITGVAAVCGDRHSFLAGVASSSLRPNKYAPVMPEFITGSISAPGVFEAAEYNVKENHPLRSLYLYRPSASAPVQNAINFTLMNGVKASLALAKTASVEDALNERSPAVAPGLSFVDAGAHGYSVVTAASDTLEVDFIGIPRPLERNNGADGGPLSYRLRHRVKRWRAGETPRLEQTVLEGKLPLP